MADVAHSSSSSRPQAFGETARRGDWRVFLQRAFVEPTKKILDVLWHALRYLVSALIVGGMLVNVVLSLLTTGTLGFTDPRSWVVVRPMMAYPRESLIGLGIFGVLALSAYIGHRARHSDPYGPELKARYDASVVHKAAPAPRYFKRYSKYYLPRHLLDSTQSADEAAQLALRTAANAHSQQESALGICVFGQATAGATRLAWEAMQKVLGNWTLIDWPPNAQGFGELFGKLHAHKAKIVLWLDKLPEYLDGPDTTLLNSLPNLVADFGLPYVVVATCQDGERETKVRTDLASLVGRLTPIRIGTLDTKEAQDLVAGLTKAGEEVHFNGGSDLTPGAIVFGVSRMRDEVYPRLPQSAKILLRTVKLLRSVGLRDYSISRVAATANSVFGLSEASWRDAYSALNRTGFLQLGELDADGQATIEPVEEVYLDVAVPDYSHAPDELKRDWQRWQQCLLQRADGKPADSKALMRLGDAFRGAGDGTRAERCYQEALTVLAQDRAPAEWALAQYNLGLVLSQRLDQQMGQPDPVLLDRALECFDNALVVFTQEKDPTRWAGLQKARLSILRRKAPSTGSRQRPPVIEKAMAASRDALKVLTREDAPEEWAETQTDLGLILQLRAQLEHSSDSRRSMLDKAIAAHEAALGALSPEKSQAIWTRAQRSLGDAYRLRAEFSSRQGKERMLAQAVEAYRAALTAMPAEDMPPEYAELQRQLGTALRSLGQFATGSDRIRLLHEACDALRAAVAGFTSSHSPQDRADTECELGATLMDYVALLDGTARAGLVTDAIHTYEDALQGYLRRGAYDVRIELRMRLAQLHYQRAMDIPGPTGDSARDDLRRAQEYIDQAFQFAAMNSNPQLRRQAATVRRDIQTKLREFQRAPA